MPRDLGASSNLSRAEVDHVQKVDLVLIGARGRVGSALRRQLARRQAALRAEANVELSLIAMFDRRGFAFDSRGLAPESAELFMLARSDGDAEKLFGYITRHGRSRALVIDCTASDEIADLYPRLLSVGVGVIAANKRANSRSLHFYRALQSAANDSGVPYRYETTVGAAIPVLGPLRDLRLRGERIISLEGVLSGSLSYILHQLHEGCLFSVAVAEATELGYTEPNPLEDLRATDLSRKLLVLGREAGFAYELEDILVEPLIDIERCGSAELGSELRARDTEWEKKVSAARDKHERLVVLVEASAEGGRVSLRSVPENSSFSQLRPGQNLISIRTELQSAIPLCVSGPGAGVEVTAAGVLGDVIAAATHWSKPVEVP